VEYTLWARGLRRHYGTGPALVRAVDDVDLAVAPGETVGIVGASGSGKSTLLHLLGGLDRPDGGEVWLGRRRLDGLSEAAAARVRRRGIGFVFQAFHLVDELTARENVELPALLAGASRRAARRRAEDLLQRVGLADRVGYLPGRLSGGQRQRVAVARALVNDPGLLLADEPTGNLDSAAATEVLRLFGALRAEGRTVVIVTHDSRVAGTADRLITMRDGAFTDETVLGPSAAGRAALAGLDL
jgi:putative ABC transport system ATP-binding protein